MYRTAVVVVLVAGCGRIGFDPNGSSTGGDAGGDVLGDSGLDAADAGPPFDLTITGAECVISAIAAIPAVGSRLSGRSQGR